MDEVMKTDRHGRAGTASPARRIVALLVTRSAHAKRLPDPGYQNFRCGHDDSAMTAENGQELVEILRAGRID